MCSKRSDWL